MRHSNSTFAYVMLLCLGIAPTQQVFAQGAGDPLTFQGLSHTTSQSAAARAAGGITFGLKNDVSLMFLNPASLTTIQGLQFSVGGLQRYSYSKQEQYYSGIQGTSAFAPLMEGTTGSISDPDTNAYYNGKKVTLVTQADSVQRPFDSIGPNWNKSKDKSQPVQFLAAVPFSLGEFRMVGGVGFVEYANLNWYYQNNNNLSPSVLSVVNGTIATAGLDRNPYAVQWYQYYQQREGSIYGYGGALSAVLSEKLSVGVSGMILKGSTDDMETRVGRGRMLFFTSSLRLDRPGTTSFTKTGTSDYSGAEFSLSAEYTSRYFNVGFSLKPPSTITRSYSTAIWQDSVAASKKFLSKIDSIHVVTNTSVSGEDKIQLPLRGTFGFGLKLREDLQLGLSYEVRSYASAQYTGSDGTTTNPWLSCSILHIGGEYTAASWLTLRAGVSNYQEVYQPLTQGIRGEPVNYPIYAIGCGVAVGNGVLNVTYEYSDMKYVDTWSNAVSINRQITNGIVASLSYDIGMPFGGKTAAERQEEELRKQIAAQEQQRVDAEMRTAEDKHRKELEAQKALEDQKLLDAQKAQEAQKAAEVLKAQEAQKAAEAQKAQKPAEPALPKPEQPKPARVEVSLQPVYFAFGTSKLAKQERVKLDAAAKVMRENPDVKMEVSGHADSIGSRLVNEKISNARANVVKRHLVKKGISGERLTTKGYGFDRPAAPNTTKQGRRLNRRAELEVVK